MRLKLLKILRHVVVHHHYRLMLDSCPSYLAKNLLVPEICKSIASDSVKYWKRKFFCYFSDSDVSEVDVGVAERFVSEMVRRL